MLHICDRFLQILELNKRHTADMCIYLQVIWLHCGFLHMHLSTEVSSTALSVGADSLAAVGNCYVFFGDPLLFALFFFISLPHSTCFITL